MTGVRSTMPMKKANHVAADDAEQHGNDGQKALEGHGAHHGDGEGEHGDENVVHVMFSPVSPAMEAAVGASSRPMTAMMEPMAAGGKMTSIHLVPTARMMSEKRMNSRPNTMKPDCAEEYPLVAMMASTGEMKAKLEPR